MHCLFKGDKRIVQDFVTNKGHVILENQKHLLIDGDILCYAAASAADGRKYRVLDAKNRPVFDTAAEANEYLEQIGLTSLWRETFYVPDPIENCLHSLKLLVEAILEDAKSTKYTIFISGSNNFRLNVTPTYKANRAVMHKPYHLKSCQQYLLAHYNARLVHGAEADDAMGIIQYTSPPETTMICSLDKDLDMIPGWHYKWGTGSNTSKTYLVTEEEGTRNFFKQLIIGDATDNIEGLSEKAPKKRTFSTKPLDSMRDVVEMIAYVGEGYLKKYKDLQTARSKCEEATKLLWILRKASAYRVVDKEVFIIP